MSTQEGAIDLASSCSEVSVMRKGCNWCRMCWCIRSSTAECCLSLELEWVETQCVLDRQQIWCKRILFTSMLHRAMLEEVGSHGCRNPPNWLNLPTANGVYRFVPGFPRCWDPSSLYTGLSVQRQNLCRCISHLREDLICHRQLPMPLLVDFLIEENQSGRWVTAAF